MSRWSESLGWAAGVAAALVSGVAALPAQVLHGVVTSGGAPAVGVQVAVPALRRATLTDDHGRYRLPALPRGEVTVTFTRLGLAAATRRVALGTDALTLDVVMAPAEAALATVQVTATAGATATRESPQPTAVLAGRALRLAQGAAVGELLAEVPGVRALSMTTGIGKPVIRGLTHNRVVTLDNGQRTETQQWGHDHSPNVETAVAEQVEVIKGPASVLYGSDALGGVVNVVQPRVPDALGGRPFVRGRLVSAYHDATRGADATVRFDAARGGLGARVALTARASGDMRTPGGRLMNTHNRAVAPDVAVGARGAWGSVAARYTRRDERIEIFDDPVASPGYSGYQRLATERANVEAVVPAGAGRVQVNVGWESNYRREFGDADAAEPSLGLLVRTGTGFVHWEHAAVGPWRGTLGVSGMHSAFTKRGTATLIPSSTARGVGLYAFEQATLGRATVSVGGRWDHRDLSVEDDAVLGLAAERRAWSAVTGSAGVRWALVGPVALVANLSRGFRAPAAPDLYANGFHEGTRAFERGDPTLAVETSLNTEAGVRVDAARFSGEVTAYRNAIADYIYLRPFGTGPRAFDSLAVAQGDARLVGVEGAAAWRAAPGVTFDVGADWVRGDNRTIGVPLTYVPPARAVYGVRLERGSLGSLRAAYLRVGGETHAAQRRVDPRDIPTDGYTLASLGAGAALFTARGAVTMDLTVRNAFDVRYRDFMSRYKEFADGLGRAVSLRVGVDF
jgi:iron complex outermembrane receptor protein